jgi:poly-gamma-glutamate synthesis protein (capsule biosynthesis protein)
LIQRNPPPLDPRFNLGADTQVVKSMVPLHMKLFLCGDVMTGRGIDQILPAPCDAELDEPWVKSALDYVSLAERAGAAIPRRASPEYIWGDALAELERARPDARM